MPVYVVTGKLGSGKTLATVGKIRDYLKEGKRVATNLDLNLEKLCGNYAKSPVVYRVPDRPSATDLDAIGLGYDGDFQGEEKNGALVLDECGTWFNSRDWNAEGRKELLDWVIHARKKRWNVYFIIQDLEVMDKQARLMFAEHVVYCRRSDRFTIPLLSSLYKFFTDKPLPMPRVHIGFVKYGDTQNSHIVDRWVYRGNDLYGAYDTSQVFQEDSDALHQLLPPYLTHGRYTNKKEDFKNAIRNLKVKGFHFFLGGALMASMTVNALVTELPGEPKKGLFGCNKAYSDLYGSCDAAPVLAKHKELVKKISDLEKSGSKVSLEKLVNAETLEKNSTLVTGQEQTEQEIVITGSVKYSNGFDYLFTKNDVPFHPGDVGYTVRWVNPCKAILLKDGKTQTIYCDETSDYKNEEVTDA